MSLFVSVLSPLSQIMGIQYTMYKVCDMHYFFGGTAQNAVLKPRYHLEKLLENSMLSMLPSAKVN